MSRKALVVVGLAAIIAASTGVAFASNTPKQIVRGADADPVASSVQSGASDNTGNEYGSFTDDSNISAQDSNAVVSAVATPSGVAESTADGQAEGDPLSADGSGVNDGSGGYSASPRIPSAQYTIRQILDQNSGEELSPRVIFGKFFNECKLTLYNDSTLDLCLNPSTGAVETGSYYIDGDLLAVNFGSDRETAFHLIFNDDGDIDYIIVPSADILIYFG